MNHTESAVAFARTQTDCSSALVDGCGRRIDHLRMSVTAACDLRCVYCRVSRSQCDVPNLLTDDQRAELVRFLCDRYRLAQVRITGGEPLLHSSVTSLIARIRESAPSLNIAMTTNGRLLKRHAAALRGAGLHRINVSLDSVDPTTYRWITGGALDDVLDGLEAANCAGFPPAKLNAVVLREFNQDQVAALALWAMRRGHEIRFLEAMPIGPMAQFNTTQFVSADEIERSLRTSFTLTPLIRSLGETSQCFSAVGEGVTGKIGFIAPVTRSFCGGCRRMRVTADGMLYPCLLDPRHVDLRDAWADGEFQETVAAEMIENAVAGKSRKGQGMQSAPMVQLGG